LLDSLLQEMLSLRICVSSFKADSDRSGQIHEDDLKEASKNDEGSRNIDLILPIEGFTFSGLVLKVLDLLTGNILREIDAQHVETFLRIAELNLDSKEESSLDLSEETFKNSRLYLNDTDHSYHSNSKQSSAIIIPTNESWEEVANALNLEDEFTENIILAEQKSPLKSTRKKPRSILAEQKSPLKSARKKPRVKDDKAQKCSLCTKTFSSDKALKNHVNIFHSEYCCQKCKEIVDIPSNHLCEHQCHVCDRYFKNKLDLKSHSDIHLDSKPFICDLCGNSFRQSSTLTRHRLTHTKENQYHCSLCGKYFRHKHYLTQHMALHTGNKPHKCDQCDKSFTQRSNMTKHIKSYHSVEREFTCPYCPKGFVGLYYLNRHVACSHKDLINEMETSVETQRDDSYRGIRTVRCDLCCVTVKSEENLMKHMETYHRGVLNLDLENEEDRI